MTTEIMITSESQATFFIAIDDSIPLRASTIPNPAISHTDNWSQRNLNK